MEKKKIMITGEGPTDYGREVGGIWRWGPVGIYVKKCLKESDMLESVELVEAKRTEIDHLKLQKRSLQGIKGMAEGTKVKMRVNGILIKCMQR